MIAYVETNFILELTYGQEQSESCEQLLALAVTGRLELRVPAYALVEARAAFRSKSADRLDLKERVEKEARQFARVRDLRGTAELIEQASNAMSGRSKEEEKRFTSVAETLRATATLLPLDARAIELTEHFRDLKVVEGEGDRLILASVIADLELRKSRNDSAPSLFITRDFDFDAAAPRALREFGCTLLTSYPAALARLDTP